MGHHMGHEPHRKEGLKEKCIKRNTENWHKIDKKLVETKMNVVFYLCSLHIIQNLFTFIAKNTDFI